MCANTLARLAGKEHPNNQRAVARRRGGGGGGGKLGVLHTFLTPAGTAATRFFGACSAAEPCVGCDTGEHEQPDSTNNAMADLRSSRMPTA